MTGIAAAALNAPSREYENRENTNDDDDDGVSYRKPRETAYNFDGCYRVVSCARKYGMLSRSKKEDLPRKTNTRERED